MRESRSHGEGKQSERIKILRAVCSRPQRFNNPLYIYLTESVRRILIHAFCSRRRRTGVNGTKAYPTIHTYLLLSLTGDCLNQNARKGYVADTENLTIGFRQISYAHTEQGLGTHKIQTQNYPHIHLSLRGRKTSMKPTMEILTKLQENSKKHHDEIFTRLYRYLLRPDIYFTAYQHLSDMLSFR